MKELLRVMEENMTIVKDSDMDILLTLNLA
jgi:hypothetical protein